MQLGLIGLGKMGGNMAERLRLGGHQVVGFDFSAEAVQKTYSVWERWRVVAGGYGEEADGTEGDLDHGAAGQARR